MNRSEHKSEPMPPVPETGLGGRAALDRGWLGRGASHFALAALAAFSAAQAWWLLGGGRVHGNDFKHLWLGSWLLGQGLNPYDPETALRAAKGLGLGPTNPFVYLPATGLIMRPLSLMSFAAASKVWFWLNWVLAWACVLLGPAAVAPGAAPGRARLARWVGACFVVGSMPFMRQMTAGQMNLALLAMILGSVGALTRGREGLAGAIMGAAAAYKISPLFMLASFALSGRWRAALAGGVVFAGLCAGAEAWAGPGAHAAALPTLASMGYGQSTWSAQGMDFYRDPFNQSINSLAHHLLTKNPYSAPWAQLSPAAANGATWAASLVLLGFWLFAGVASRRAIAEKRKAADREAQAPPKRAWGFRSAQRADPAEVGFLMISTLMALLLPSLMWDHYAVQTLAAAFWLAAMGPAPMKIDAAAPRPSPRAALFWGVFAAAFWALSWPLPHPKHNHGPELLLMSLRLWGTLGVLALTWVRWRDLGPRGGRPAPVRPATDNHAEGPSK